MDEGGTYVDGEYIPEGRDTPLSEEENQKAFRMGQFRCWTCEEWKDITEIGSSEVFEDGRRRYFCVKCRTEVNLCESCIHDFAVCKGKPVFGRGIGNDNVCGCGEYEEEVDGPDRD